ncbi:MAG: tRNA1(Val) (adenine(37)-N6)-methyltransferase, partial [Rhodospirillaceae bacterium]
PKAEGAYRAAMDSVLLAACVTVRPGDSLLDAGAGTGAVALSLSARLGPVFAGTGLEILDSARALAQRSAALQEHGSAWRFVQGDLLDPSCRETLSGPFDQVVSNPPFAASGTASPNAVREAAMRGVGRGVRRGVERGEGARAQEVSVENWIAACLACLRPKGRLTLIQRADMLDRVLAALRGQGAGEVAILPIRQNPTAPARRVVVSARRGIKSPCCLLPDFLLEQGEGRPTDRAVGVFRHAEAIPMSVLPHKIQ